MNVNGKVNNVDLENVSNLDLMAELRRRIQGVGVEQVSPDENSFYAVVNTEPLSSFARRGDVSVLKTAKSRLRKGGWHGYSYSITIVLRSDEARKS